MCEMLRCEVDQKNQKLLKWPKFTLKVLPSPYPQHWNFKWIWTVFCWSYFISWERRFFFLSCATLFDRVENNLQIKNWIICVSEINMKCEIMEENVHQMNDVWNFDLEIILFYNICLCWFLFCQRFFVTFRSNRSNLFFQVMNHGLQIFFNDFKFIPIELCQSEYHWNEWPKR